MTPMMILTLLKKIITKKYNSHRNQYEYLVKWQGYTDEDNTWELPDNIPSTILDKFEQSLLYGHEPRKVRLRQNRKLIAKKNFILNV